MVYSTHSNLLPVRITNTLPIGIRLIELFNGECSNKTFYGGSELGLTPPSIALDSQGHP